VGLRADSKRTRNFQVTSPLRPFKPGIGYERQFDTSSNFKSALLPWLMRTLIEFATSVL
jgi:hypothetical protein